MKKLILTLRITWSHIRIFGWGWITFLYHKNLKKSRLIRFHIPQVPKALTLRNNSSDIPTFNQVSYRRDYDLAYPFEPAVIVDLGANIGLSAVYFKSRFPEAKIIYLELGKENFKILMENTRDYPDVHCLEHGIWNKNTLLEIKDPGFREWALMTSETNSRNTGAVEFVTMNDVCSQFGIHKIDFLKVDIEGSEKELFESNYKTWLSKVGMLIIELHNHMRAGYSKSFFRAMANYDFRIYNQGETLICLFNH